MSNWLDKVKWNEDGLVPVVVQDINSKKVLMHAWMNREALKQTRQAGKAVYWSRSRQQLWMKGESSGHVQYVESIKLDCDCDTLLLTVKQEGGIACHTGREHCFFMTLENDEWKTTEDVIKDPAEIYKNTL